MKKLRLGDWASIAEIVGTVAVVFSLAIVIVSIRQNTAVVRATSEAFYYDLTDRWLTDMLSNPEVLESWERLIEGEPVTPTERLKVMIMIARSMNMWENAYANYKSGLLSVDQWRLIHNSNVQWAKRRIPTSIWPELAEGMHQDFIDLVEADYLGK